MPGLNESKESQLINLLTKLRSSALKKGLKDDQIKDLFTLDSSSVSDKIKLTTTSKETQRSEHENPVQHSKPWTENLESTNENANLESENVSCKPVHEHFFSQEQFMQIIDKYANAIITAAISILIGCFITLYFLLRKPVLTSPCAVDTGHMYQEFVRPMFDCDICRDINAMPVEWNISKTEFYEKYSFTGRYVFKP